MNDWQNIEVNGEVHCIPRGDLREHSPSWECWCHPREDSECPMFTHHSMDQREQYEQGRKPS